ncbi:MAG: hypothetical protein K2R98_10945 [Gemmataceae bacterium]|nr:hypothetical protein [Gemmataceae bacterium]
MPTTLTPPEWLTRRGASMRQGINERSWFVYFAGQPQYEVTPMPVKGKFGCEIRQTINGKRLDGQGMYPTSEEALRGGLEELRKTLGW